MVKCAKFSGRDIGTCTRGNACHCLNELFGNSEQLESFRDAMQEKHGYRPELLPSGVLMHSRDSDRFEGWQLALSRLPHNTD